MGKKQLFFNLIANFVAFGTSLCISFVLTPFLITSIGKEAYSFYPISNNFVSYFSIITIAIDSMASRFITIEIVKRNMERAKIYYSSVFFANIIIVGLLSIPMITIIVFLNSILNIPIAIFSEIRLLFILVFASMIVSVITSVFGVATFAKNRLDLRSSGEIIQGLIKVALYVSLFTLFKPSIVFIGLTSFILTLTNFVIQTIFTKFLLSEFNLSYKYFSFAAIKEIITSGVWNSINSLGSVLILSVSLLLANILINATAAGELSIVQTLPSFMSGLIAILLAAFMPRITYKYAIGNKDELIKEIIFSQKVVGLLSTTPIVLIIVFGQDFYKLWVPMENANKLQTLSIISVIPFLIFGNVWTLYGLNVVINKVKTPSLVLIGVGFLNVLVSYSLLNIFNGNLLIIPAVSSILSVIYYMFFIPIYVTKQIGISKFSFYPHIIKSLLFAFIFITLGTFFREYICISSWAIFFLWGGIFGATGLIMNSLLILNFNDLKSIRSLLLRK